MYSADAIAYPFTGCASGIEMRTMFRFHAALMVMSSSDTATLVRGISTSSSVHPFRQWIGFSRKTSEHRVHHGVDLVVGDLSGRAALGDGEICGHGAVRNRISCRITGD